MKKKKRSSHSKWIIVITSALIGTAIPILLLYNLFSNFSFDSECPIDQPDSFYGYNLPIPQNYDNLWSSCGGLQGWSAQAHFDIVPEDLDNFIIQAERWLGGTLTEILPDRMEVETGFYGYVSFSADSGKEVFIDTTNSDSYHVSVFAFGE